MIDYRYELKKYIKNEYKICKKSNFIFPDNIKREIDILINNLDEEKLEIVYKYKYVVFNQGIRITELEDVYRNLFRKILFAENNSCILKNKWDNIFNTFFGNIPGIYEKHSKTIIKKTVDSFYVTRNEFKLKLLMILFKIVYNIENTDLKYIDTLLNYINKTDEEYILKSYESIILNLSKILDNVTISKDKIEYLFSVFSKSKSKYNSEKLSQLLNIVCNNIINNERIYELFDMIVSSSNNEFIESLLLLLENIKFRDMDENIQNRCINILKNVESSNYIKIKYINKIILEIIVCENDKIQNYLLNKLETIKREETLMLILTLTPLLNEFIDETEYIKVIDSLEDKDKNITKKLEINLNYMNN